MTDAVYYKNDISKMEKKAILKLKENYGRDYEFIEVESNRHMKIGQFTVFFDYDYKCFSSGDQTKQEIFPTKCEILKIINIEGEIIRTEIVPVMRYIF